VTSTFDPVTFNVFSALGCRTIKLCIDTNNLQQSYCDLDMSNLSAVRWLKFRGFSQFWRLRGSIIHQHQPTKFQQNQAVPHQVT